MIILDYKDKRPIYEQIVDKFSRMIISGVLESDSKMPSVRSLAVELSINPNTIQRAYAELERQGYIYSIKGRGNFVCPSEEFADKEKEKAMDELMEHLNRCKQVGITKAEIEQILLSAYEEG